jgi:chemotaxis protein MotB
MVSYADFITLLFAFFVVMYSISSVNEGKYKSLTHSLGTAFSNKNNPEIELPPAQRGTPFATIQPISLDNSVVTFDTITLDDAVLTFKPIPLDNSVVAFKLIPSDNPDMTFTPITSDNPTTAEVEQRRELSEEILKERRQLNQVSNQLEKALEPFIDNKLVAVKRNDYWIALEMNSELLFLSGEATLSKKAAPVLKKISDVINPLPNAINVEGHTDNVPIDTLKFPSNWDLSSARATSVVQEFVKEGINPSRLSAIGYGEFHPLGDNKTEEGRFKNRRVILVLMSQAFSRYGANDAERAKLLNLVPTAPSDETPVSKQ